MDESSYAANLKEIGDSFQELTKNEMNLFRAEMKESLKAAKSDVLKFVTFGSIVALSALPFITFLVIGLGVLLDENYWLSALIVSAIMAATGAFFTLRAYRHLKEEDLSLPLSRNSIRRERELILRQLYNLRN